MDCPLHFVFSISDFCAGPTKRSLKFGNIFKHLLVLSQKMFKLIKSKIVSIKRILLLIIFGLAAHHTLNVEKNVQYVQDGISMALLMISIFVLLARKIKYFIIKIFVVAYVMWWIDAVYNFEYSTRTLIVILFLF